MSKIDDPFEAEWEIANSPSRSAGAAAAQSAITIFGQFAWWLKPIAAAFNLSSAAARQKRVMDMLSALHDQLVRLGNKHDDLERRLENLSSSPEFINAIYAAADGAASLPSSNRHVLLGRAVANSLIVIPNAESYEQYIGNDLESIMRDLTQVSDLDLRTLGFYGMCFQVY